MVAKSVQISLDEELLAEIDRREETREKGRSAIIRAALRQYLRDKQRQEVDESYRQAYEGQADAIFEEFSPLLGEQAWPEE